MASQIIPFESVTLPAHLKGLAVADANAGLTSHTGPSFASLSIKGKVFTIVRGGDRTILPNPLDPDSPASSIDVVIVKANKSTAKIYYAEKYADGSDAKPDCYSNDGVAPAADATKPQAKACMTCPHNQWGARITDAGKKGKTCQDVVRIAVTTPTQLNDPYLMRVPPGSLKNMAEYGNMLTKRGVTYNAVVTKVSFDPAEATPKLVFKPVGFLDVAAYAEAVAIGDSEIVAQIIGSTPALEAATAEAQAVVKAAASPTKDKVVKQEEVVAAVAAAALPAPVAPIPTATPAAVPVAGAIEVDLSDLNFD